MVKEKVEGFVKETSESIENMSLMHDYCMSRVFDENIPATKLLISIVLQTDVEVIMAKGQWDIKNGLSGGRGIRLDIFAKDQEGKFFDCEVQRDDKGAIPRRARFHSSILDTRMLKEGQEFEEFHDSYVIFITKNDYFKKDKPIYSVARKLEDGELFDDGSHIIYVNGRYDGDDALGHLMSDMRNRTTEGFYYKELEDGVKHFKENEEGWCDMYESIEDIRRAGYNSGREEGREEGRESTLTASIRNIMEKFKITAEEAMDTLDIPKNERSKYMAML